MLDRPVPKANQSGILVIRRIDVFLLSGGTVRTTLNIDDGLPSEAQRITGVTEKAALVREDLRALIESESARRLACVEKGMSGFRGLLTLFMAPRCESQCLSSGGL
jgi:Arc/MetJ family transcription regulator